MMPSDSGGCSGHRADGYIDPFAIPGAGLDADLIRRAAASFASASTAAATHGADVVSKWSGIFTAYQAPEAPNLIETMAPVKTGTESLSAVFLAASQALTAFADEVDRIKPELTQLTGEAEQFITGVVGSTDEGTKIPDYVPDLADRNNDLMRRVAAQVDALAHARDTCVAALSGLDSPMYWLSRGPGQGPAASAASDTSIGTVLPFGTMKERSCQEAQMHGAVEAARESVTGGLALVGFDTRTRQAFDGDLALHSWQGAALSVFLVTTLVSHSDLTDPAESAPRLMKALAPSLRAQRGQVVEGFLGSEEAWKTNPGRALGGVEFNVGSVLTPGAEAGAGLKVLASGASGLRFGARATELGAEGAADAARAGEASSGLRRALGGTGAVSGRVGDLVSGMSRGVESSVSGSVTGFRDLLARVPKVSVSVQHMVTPDGMRVPTGVRMDVEPRAGSRMSAEADHHGPGEARRSESPNDISTGEHRSHGSVSHSGGDALSGDPQRAPAGVKEHEVDHPAHPGESENGVRGHVEVEPANPGYIRHRALHEGGSQRGNVHVGDGASGEGVVKLKGLELIHARLADPRTQPFRIPMLKGQEFNLLNHHRFPVNEKRVWINVKTKARLPDGSIQITIERRYTIVDSYIPNEGIYSRKYTQFSEIQPKTAKGYLDEVNKKYPPGAQISGTTDTLQGDLFLEIPPQVKPIPQDIIDYANSLYPRLTLIDTSGHIYNP